MDLLSNAAAVGVVVLISTEGAVIQMNVSLAGRGGRTQLDIFLFNFTSLCALAGSALSQPARSCRVWNALLTVPASYFGPCTARSDTPARVPPYATVFRSFS